MLLVLQFIDREFVTYGFKIRSNSQILTNFEIRKNLLAIARDLVYMYVHSNLPPLNEISAVASKEGYLSGVGAVGCG